MTSLKRVRAFGRAAAATGLSAALLSTTVLAQSVDLSQWSSGRITTGRS